MRVCPYCLSSRCQTYRAVIVLGSDEFYANCNNINILKRRWAALGLNRYNGLNVITDYLYLYHGRYALAANDNWSPQDLEAYMKGEEPRVIETFGDPYADKCEPRFTRKFIARSRLFHAVVQIHVLLGGASFGAAANDNQRPA